MKEQHPQVHQRSDRKGTYWFFRYWQEEPGEDVSIKPGMMVRPFTSTTCVLAPTSFITSASWPTAEMVFPVMAIACAMEKLLSTVRTFPFRRIRSADLCCAANHPQLRTATQTNRTMFAARGAAEPCFAIDSLLLIQFRGNSLHDLETMSWEQPTHT